jgi:pyridoxal phosphate enzyme (YggS family)
MDELGKRYQAVRERITQAALQAGRNPDSVQLLVVSKTFGADKVSQVAALGQCDFGENYVQEGVDKISALQGLKGLVWHCIGPLQSNKTRPVAEHFDWVHSVDRLKIAQRLSEQRPAHLPPLQVCLQVNIDGGATKAGVVPTEALALAQAVAVLPRLVLRGLMTSPSQQKLLMCSWLCINKPNTCLMN